MKKKPQTTTRIRMSPQLSILKMKRVRNLKNKADCITIQELMSTVQTTPRNSMKRRKKKKWSDSIYKSIKLFINY